MSILIIGKTGQVARELQRLGGEKIFALDRQAADLTNPDACADVIRKTKARMIINAAAFTAVDQAETEGALRTKSMPLLPGQWHRRQRHVICHFCISQPTTFLMVADS